MIQMIFCILFLIACVPVMAWCKYLEIFPGKYDEALYYAIRALELWIFLLALLFSAGNLRLYFL